MMTKDKNLKPEWRKVKFGDVVRLSKARCADPLAEGVERFVGLEHLEPGDMRIRTWGNVADGVTFTSVFKPGQVLFGKRRAYQRKVAVADFSGVCSGDIYVLESQDANVLMPELLPFICQTDAFFDHAVGTSAGSLKSWGGVLEASYVAHFLPTWFRNYGKRVVKTPKFYFYDAALVNLLTRQPDAASALAGPMGGPLLEGWVVIEAVKAFMSLGRKPDLYFWRSHDGLEVDLLIVIDGKLQPVEIKLTATPGAGHVEPINRFLAVAGDEASKQGILVCRTETERALPNGHVAMPWQSFPDWLRKRLSKAVA